MACARISPSSTRKNILNFLVPALFCERKHHVCFEQMQVKALVKTSVLPEVALPLQEELTEQWQQWEKEYERGNATHLIEKCFANDDLSDWFGVGNFSPID